MKNNKLFFILCVLAFLILFGHGVARPAAESLFLTQQGSKQLPLVWLIEAVFAVILVPCISLSLRWLSVIPLFIMLHIASMVLEYVLNIASQQGLAWGTFGLYLWKDLYVVVLIELFWSITNLTHSLQKATKRYGILCASGTLGGLAGSAIVKPLATSIGSTQVLHLTIPILILTAFLAWPLRRFIHDTSDDSIPDASWRLDKPFRLSTYVWLLAALVGTTQIVTNLVDFQFNQILEHSYTNTDIRSGYIGTIYAIVGGVGLCLQLMTEPILTHVKIKHTLILIPCSLLATASTLLLYPGALSISLCKVAGKSLDYSLFRAAKEMLYIPLSYREKTEGKTLADVMAYRVAKGIASALLMLITIQNLTSITWISILFLCLWILITLKLVHLFEYRLSSNDHHEGT